MNQAVIAPALGTRPGTHIVGRANSTKILIIHLNVRTLRRTRPSTFPARKLKTLDTASYFTGGGGGGDYGVIKMNYTLFVFYLQEGLAKIGR